MGAFLKKELRTPSEPVSWIADYPLNYGCRWREYRVNLAKRKYLYAMIVRLLVFLVVNFTALAIGGLATKNGVSSDWYAQLNKAPWTPPGWVFGAAWTSIMVCYAIYMAYAWEIQLDKKHVLLLFIAQWILNVLWNPVFFSSNCPYWLHFIYPIGCIKTKKPAISTLFYMVAHSKLFKCIYRI
jgi:tryptophan-rich sensory protein